MRNIGVGIDVGTSVTRVVVGEFIKGEINPRVIGVGEGETKGLRHGYVTTISEVTSSIEKAVLQAEKSANIKIRKAIVSIGGMTLRSEIGNGAIVISKADGEVTNLDIDKALDECEDSLNLSNKKVLRIIPISYKLDGKDVPGRPEGMHGNKLEVKALIISCSSQHFDNMLTAVTEAGIDVIDVIPGPIAGSEIGLSKKQKVVGSALINIGAETTSLIVFENELPISIFTFSIGSSDVTNDIALGLKITLEEAEGLKLGTVDQNYSKKKLDEIIEARFTDIFELVDNHLKKLKRSELLPAGIVFIGGGANTKLIEEMSKNTLKLPSKVGTTMMFGNVKTKLRDPAWFTVLGLLMSGKDSEQYTESSLPGIFKELKSIFKSAIKQLKP